MRPGHAHRRAEVALGRDRGEAGCRRAESRITLAVFGRSWVYASASPIPHRPRGQRSPAKALIAAGLCLDEPLLFALYARPAHPPDSLFSLDYKAWRRGREAEGGGLLNRYTVKSRIEGSNPSVSASCQS